MTEIAEQAQIQRWTPAARAFMFILAILVVGLALMPFAATPDFTSKATTLFGLIILATMWNALAGYAGMVSVGQQAFIGFGAYMTIILTDHGVGGYPAIALAALIAGAISLPVSFLVFRLRGGQFAIAMWVVAEVFRLVTINTNSVGGGTGHSLTALNFYEPATRQALTYWMALALMVVLLGAVFILLRSRLGASLRAIRDDEEGAASLGVRVQNTKRVVFVLAALGCAAAGGLILANTLFVTPNSIYGVEFSALMIFMVLIGGLGTFEGPIVGAVILFGIQEQFADQGVWYLAGLGVFAILVVLVFPRGIWGTIADRFNLRLMPVGYRLRVPSAKALPAAAADASSASDKSSA